MAETDVRVAMEVDFQLQPEALFVPDVLAVGADWQKVVQHLDFP